MAKKFKVQISKFKVIIPNYKKSPAGVARLSGFFNLFHSLHERIETSQLLWCF